VLVKLIQSEWVKYQRNLYFYMYFLLLLLLPFLLRILNIQTFDETLTMIIITLTITVVAATEIPRYCETGIIRTITLSNISRRSFYFSRFIKYILFYILSFVVGFTSLAIAFSNTITFTNCIKIFFIYLVINFFYVTFSQFLSLLYKRTVESLMTSILLLFVIFPLCNVIGKKYSFYSWLPLLYTEPKNFFVLNLGEIGYGIVLLISCGLLFQTLAVRKFSNDHF